MKKRLLKNLKVKKIEREAEVFAAYLLIPEEKLNAVLKRGLGSGIPRPNSRTSRRIPSITTFYEKEA